MRKANCFPHHDSVNQAYSNAQVATLVNTSQQVSDKGKHEPERTQNQLCDIVLASRQSATKVQFEQLNPSGAHKK